MPRYANALGAEKEAHWDQTNPAGAAHQADKPIQPIKPIRPVKPIAPIGYEYVWRD
jgi:hypothetical protein